MGPPPKKNLATCYQILVQSEVQLDFATQRQLPRSAPAGPVNQRGTLGGNSASK